MKANELRIGNWVYFHDGVFKIEPLTIFNISNEPQNYKPIPLTEEILLKSGAVKLDKLFPSYNLHGIVLNMVNNNWIEYVSRVKLNYVHKLQNFYYTHKEQELNIEL